MAHVTLTHESPASPPTQAPATSSTDLPAAEHRLPLLCRRPVRLGLYAMLVAILLLMLAWRFVPVLLDPTFEKHIENKQVIVGMSRQQVLKAWGSPYTMNVTYTKDGLRREEWVYEDWLDAATVKHRYLYFEEDVLVGGWYYK